ncbi:hypothetical protein BRD17_03245 [Halobacteriales archaeon SW_7_68_16]|nr:MAG: hypothetical protein BRD17_03245 [Halobacteriales archaeon SW_7_68_16]
MDPLSTLAVALWTMLPAYVPNNAAVLVGGGSPIDGGRTLDGNRLLGDGKTWRGSVGGIAAGVAVALLLSAIAPAVSTTVGVPFPTFPMGATLSLPVGAILGDVLASFVKRRLGRQRGAAVLGLDQLDFVAVALGATVLIVPGWSEAVFTVPVLVVVLVVTPLLHVSANVLAYHAGLKPDPW